MLIIVAITGASKPPVSTPGGEATHHEEQKWGKNQRTLVLGCCQKIWGPFWNFAKRTTAPCF